MYVKGKEMVPIGEDIPNLNNLNNDPDRDYYRERFNDILRRRNYIPQDRWWINVDENIPPEINVNPQPNPPPPPPQPEFTNIPPPDIPNRDKFDRKKPNPPPINPIPPPEHIDIERRN